MCRSPSRCRPTWLVPLVVIALAGCSGSSTPDASTPADLSSTPDFTEAMSVMDLASSTDQIVAVDFSISPDLFVTHDLATVDLVPGAPSCAVSGGCPSGPACGGTCCAAGESCDLTTNTCMCGGSAACGTGEICARGGAVMPGKTCGVICCGTPGHPCPA